MNTSSRKVRTLSTGKSTDKLAGRSQIVALLCVLFFGLLGIHRFYLGYFGIGLVQLFTLGGLGIWVTVGFFRILFRDLWPADGLPYDPTF
jgi:TM2 domain-containing membrane protein YozV